MPVLEYSGDNRSVAEIVAELEPDERREVLQKLTPAQQSKLRFDWNFWGRPKQQEPTVPYFCWLLLAGRGFGKTHTGAQWIKRRVHAARDAGKPVRLALVAETAADVRDVMVNGPSGIIASSDPDFMPVYQPSRRRIYWPDGSEAFTFSGDEPGQLRGPNFDGAWVDELAKYTYPDETWDNLEFGLRLGDNPQVVVTTTPRPIPIVVTLYEDPQTVVTTGSSYENIGNLAATFIQRVLKKYEGTRLGRQELHAEILRDVPGALWTIDMLTRTRCRLGDLPTDMIRYSVSVDPATSSTDKSNETGICVVGKGANGHGFLFHDGSGVLTSSQWAKRANGLYHRWRATRILGEANNGGDLVEANVKAHDNSVHFRKVWAVKSKGNRAEPIAGFYEQDRIHHVGYFPEIEQQMILITRDEYLGPGSPDRLDSVVWGMHDIMYGSQNSYNIDDYATSKR